MEYSLELLKKKNRSRAYSHDTPPRLTFEALLRKAY